MKTKQIKEMQLVVWKALAERRAVIDELKSANIALGMHAAQNTRLARVVHAASVFAIAQNSLETGDVAIDEFQDLEDALATLTQASSIASPSSVPVDGENVRQGEAGAPMGPAGVAQGEGPG